MNRFPAIFLILTLFLAGCDDSGGPDVAPAAKTYRNQPGAEIIEKFLNANDGQQTAMRGVSMEVVMDAKLPKLKKEGKLSALRQISNLGRITYKVLGFAGDDTVKKEVIARFMTAETQAKTGTDSIALNPDNYKFKYKGISDRDQKQVHIFEVRPRHKRIGLFKGELWIDPSTYLPVREVGALVKNPSIFLKKTEFVRDYEIRDGVAFLKRFDSRVETRIVGVAELNIQYTNLQKSPEPAGAVEGVGVRN